MRAPSIPFLAALAAALLPFATPAAARSLQLEAGVVATPQIRLERLRLQARTAGEGGTVQLAVARLRSPVLGLDSALDWQCPLRRDGTALVCTGPLRLGEQQASLTLRWQQQGLHLQLQREQSAVELDLPAAGAPRTARLQALPLVWLAPALAANWRGGRIDGGVVDAELGLDADGTLHARGALRALDLASHDGSLALRGVDVEGSVDYAQDADAPRLVAQLQLARGRIGVGVLQAELPAAAVQVDIDATRQSGGVWDFARLAFNDPAALAFEGSAQFDPQAAAPLRRLRVDSAQAVFPLAMQRYLHGVLAAHALADLELAGELRGSLDSDEQGLAGVLVSSPRLDVRWPSQALAIDGLHGAVDWRRDGSGSVQTLAWRQARRGAITIDALQSRWQVRAGVWQLHGPLQARLFGGSLQAQQLVLRPPGGDGPWLSTTLALRGIGYDAPAGTFGAAAVNLDATLQLAGPLATPQVHAQLHLQGGQYLAGALYVELPPTPVSARLEATLGTTGWDVAAFEWHDPGVLEVTAHGQWTAPVPALPTFELKLRQVDLARAVPRYAAAWLAARGYPHLRASGTLAGSFTREDGRARAFGLVADAVEVDDGDGRFKIHGLDGAVAWNARSVPAPTTLGWQGIEVYKVPFGPAQARLGADHDSLRLLEPLAIEVFGGKLNLRKFVAQPASPRGDRYEASFTIIQAQLPQMSAAFGWPVFPGNLSGGVPEIEFVGDRIDFHGGLDLYLFDGHLGVNTMSLERPFGSAPALGANIHFEDFDLTQLTSAFSFGSMSGRLYGTINDLRLLDWSTVAFDAWLRTKGGGRMSYKAVDDITGIASGAPMLQNLALKLVNTFGFARLGLRCRLRDQVCTMGGIEPLAPPQANGDSLAARGYAIVEGAGLPRIDIVGHRRHVDWPTLVRRLHEATQGQAPIIQ